MKRTVRTIVSFLLIMSVLTWQMLTAAPDKGFSSLMNTVYAANSGTCGSGVKWTLSAGTLTISGSGSMSDFDGSSSHAPWYPDRTSITKVVIESGVNTVGRYAFDGCTSLLSVSFPVTVTMLRNYAFNGCTRLNAIYVVNLTQWAKTEINGAYCHPFYSSDGGDLYLSDKRLTDPVIGADTNIIKRFTFYKTKNFSSVTIKEGVKTIGFGAFNSSGMKTLTVPDTVSAIEQAAFYGCSKLTDVYYDNTPAEWNKISINETGKMNDPLLKAVMHYTLGKGKCGDDLKWAFTDDGVFTVTGTGAMYDYEYQKTPWWGYRGNIKKLVIKNGATSIGNYAFNNCYSLASASLPATLKSIGKSAFTACAFTYFVMPSGITSVGQSAFQSCDKLNSVFIPGGVTEISPNVFQSCTALVSVTLPSQLTRIGSSAFYGCSSLKSISFPSTLTTIGSYAFCNCKALGSVSLPSGFGSVIEEGAFCNCSALKTAYIPESVKTVNDKAFKGCAALADVYYTGYREDWKKISIGSENDPLIKATLHCIGRCGDDLLWTLEDGTLTITGTGPMYDYEYKTSPWYGEKDTIQKIVIGSGATVIGEYAFDDCRNTTSVSIPQTVTEIKEYAFSYCRELESIALSSGLKIIGYGAFYQCDKLKSVVIPKGVERINRDTFHFCEGLESVTLPEGLKYIDNYAFSSCKALKSVTLPSTLLLIESSGFAYCTALENVKFLSDNTKLAVGVFRESASLKTITLPSAQTTIPLQCFDGCKALKTIYIPGGVTKIYDKAFNGCAALTDVYFDNIREEWDKITVGTNNDPLKTATIHCKSGGYCGDDLVWMISGDTLTITGTGPMYDYNRTDKKTPWYDQRLIIKKIIIKSGATYIGTFAFSGCVKAESITLPESLTDTGRYCMLRCSSLKDIKLPSGLKTIGYGSFSGCSSLKSVTLPDSLEIVDSYLFDGCTALESVKFPTKLKAISAFAFYGCESLKSISIPSTVTSIEQCAFCGCSSLKSVTVPDSVKKLNYKSFKSCTALESVTLPKDLTAIEYEMFTGCSALKTVYIPGGVESIGTGTFSGCTALTDVYFNSIRPVWDKVVIGSANDRLKDSAKCTIHCLYFIPGDINYDGAVDNRDLVRYMKYCSGESVEVCAAALDTNDDSKKDARDLTHLMRYLSGESVTLY